MALRFVILAHSGHGPLHYDLMLQRGRALVTWQFAQDPGDSACRPLPARRIRDHRLAYLTREGAVSRGRGRVDRVDQGTYGLLDVEDARWRVRLCGRRLVGRFELRRTEGALDEWTFRRLSPDPSSAPSPPAAGEATETPA